MKEFKFQVAQSKEPTIELIQLMSLCIQEYDLNNSLGKPVDMGAVLAYFNQLYGFGGMVDNINPSPFKMPPFYNYNEAG